MPDPLETMRRKTSNRLSRRGFIRLGGAGAAGVALGLAGMPYLLRARDANGKLNLAVIGAGAQGRTRMKEALGSDLVNIAALCDVDTNGLDAAKAEIANYFPAVKLDGTRLYADYRKLLANEKDLDAVIIATPDHWHAPIAKASMLAGKHVFCEKPLTHTISEARELRRVAAQSKVVTQMGNQGSASRNLRRGIELIQAGVIGKVTGVHCLACGVSFLTGMGIPAGGDPVPGNLNWDEWLGPAPARAYKESIYHPYRWRAWYDFGNGAMGDFGCHMMNLPYRALKLDYPVEIDASADLKGLATYPTNVRIDYRFAQRGDLPPITVTWYDGGNRPEPSVIPKELDQDRSITHGNCLLIIGENGFTLGDNATGSDYIFLKGDTKPWGILDHPACKNIPKTLPESPGHVKEWIDACLGGKPVFSDFETGGHLTEIALSGVVALKTGKKLDWDGPGMKARNASEADQYIQAQYRPGWV